MSMTTARQALPALGSTARFDLDNGDSYIGEVTEIHGNAVTPRCSVTLRNYSAWYEGDSRPYNSPYFDDEVRFAIDNKTVVVDFAAEELAA